ncbi:hypothetical protein [Saccharothrix sp. ST-888]|uniref:hypothetical protein n=1 Tax=Saccharothrix sp. ST-888 TaxID=1427391 RepID=UPI000698BFB3|nr:hypothetical protein [Saccharothrix sp. ST-888]
MPTFDSALLRPAALASTGEDLLPVLPALAPLLPGGGLRRGAAVSVQGDTGLLLALAAGAAAVEGTWSAAVGLPDLGLAAAAGYGFDLRRLLLVDDPGQHWPEVVAALSGAVGLILLRPDGPVPAQLAARLTAVLRRGGCALLVAGPWPGAGLRLGVRSARWFGLGEGYGQLLGRQAEVTAEGRGAGARARTARLWLPDEHGGARVVEPAESDGAVPAEAVPAGAVSVEVAGVAGAVGGAGPEPAIGGLGLAVV